ncbi:MAG: EamA family transporter [Deltaproteobacteria bacterium]|nr:MAG: EamA family transporter [Deltaproteobacteria bacterium]
MLTSEFSIMFKGYFFIITAASCWAAIGIFSSIAFAQGISPMEVAFWRAAIAWLFFCCQAIMTGNTRIRGKDVFPLVVFAFLGISLFYISYQYAVQSGGAAFASVLLYTAPAWVVFCSWIFSGEKPRATRLFAVLLVIAGVFCIAQNGAPESSARSFGGVALVAGITAGFCYSLYYTVGKYFISHYSSANLFLYVLPLGILGILPFVSFAPKNIVAWAALLGVSVISTYIANFCYYQSLKYLEPGRASLVATVEPVFAAVAAFFFFGEYFRILGYLGAAMILCAVILTVSEKSPAENE